MRSLFVTCGKLFLSILALSCPITTHAQTTSTKRGLIYIPSSLHPEDNNLWSVDPSQLSWYYNYQSTPSSPLQVIGNDRKQLEFVPMLWGDTDSAAQFPAVIRSLIDRGETIRYVLGPNEPDMPSSVGGSNISPARAAALWRSSIEPLAALGIRLGSPAISGSPTGVEWLNNFLTECSDCTISFLNLHWYGNFEGLASHLGYVGATFPGRPLWVTELGYAHVDLGTTQSFFNESVAYLERLENVERYSWFGAFREDASNVGENGALLDSQGQLKEIGQWYLGSDADSVTAGTEKMTVWRWRVWGVIGLVVIWLWF